MSLRIKEVAGKIERRILVGYGFEPEVITPLLPQGILPKIVNGKAVVGLCLIHFDYMRPTWIPLPTGIPFESAAHRIGIQWETQQGDIENGVYVAEQYTNSQIINTIGGKFFPGVQELSRFNVREDKDQIKLRIHNENREIKVDIKPSTEWKSSLFSDIEQAAAFYKPPKGWSRTLDQEKVEGVEMRISNWNYENWEPNEILSSFFEQFPEGSYTYDHTIVMRNLPVKYSAPNVSRDFK
jgi:hypothetical protein